MNLAITETSISAQSLTQLYLIMKFDLLNIVSSNKIWFCEDQLRSPIDLISVIFWSVKCRFCNNIEQIKTSCVNKFILLVDNKDKSLLVWDSWKPYCINKKNQN